MKTYKQHITEVEYKNHMRVMTSKEQAKYEDLMADYRELSVREKRAKFKPFGRLGKLTNPEQVVNHMAFGTKKHDMGFFMSVAEFDEFKCRECGKRIQYTKGGSVRRR